MADGFDKEPTEERESVQSETKSERFKRIATRRTQNVLYALRVLGNCSNRSAYEYTDEDIRKIFSAVERQLADVKVKFRANSKQEFKL